MSRRWVRVSIIESMLRLVLAGRREVAITSDWPADAQVVGGEWDTEKGMMKLTIWSSRFDDVPLGNVIPDWNPTFTAHAVEPAALSLMTMIDRMQDEINAEGALT